MYRISLILICSLAIRCGGSEESQPSIPSDEPASITTSPSNSEAQMERKAPPPPGPDMLGMGSDPVNMLRTRLNAEEGHIDTLLRFEEVPLDQLRHFRYSKMEVNPEENSYIIQHPNYNYRLGEMPFDSAFSKLTYNDDSSSVVLINGLTFYGTNGEIPRTQFSRFTYTPKEGDLQIIRPEDYEDLFNLNFEGEGKTANPTAYNLPNSETIITFKGGSDSARYIAAFWFNGQGKLKQRRIQKLD